MNRLGCILIVCLLIGAIVWLAWKHGPVSPNTVGSAGGVKIHFPPGMEPFPLSEATPSFRPIACMRTPDHRKVITVGLIPDQHFADMKPGTAAISTVLQEYLPSHYGGNPISPLILNGHVVYRFLNSEPGCAYYSAVWDSDSGMVVMLALLHSADEVSEIDLDF